MQCVDVTFLTAIYGFVIVRLSSDLEPPLQAWPWLGDQANDVTLNGRQWPQADSNKTPLGGFQDDSRNQ
jgi:hypothetical protein